MCKMTLFLLHSYHQLYIIPSSSSFYGRGKLCNQAFTAQARVTAFLYPPSSSSITTIFALFLIQSLLPCWDQHQLSSDYDKIPNYPYVLSCFSQVYSPHSNQIYLKNEPNKKSKQTKHGFKNATVLLKLFISLFQLEYLKIFYYFD